MLYAAVDNIGMITEGWTEGKELRDLVGLMP